MKIIIEYTDSEDDQMALKRAMKSNDLSAALFEIYYPTQSHDEFLKWRHHRRFNSWQDDIYWMSDTVFQYHWPLIAGALAEVKSSD